jgi:hypothetical protein
MYNNKCFIGVDKMRENDKKQISLHVETYHKLIMFKNKLYNKETKNRNYKQVGFDEAMSVALTVADRILFEESDEQQTLNVEEKE